MSNIKVKLFSYHADVEQCLRVYSHMMTSKNIYKISRICCCVNSNL